MTNFTKNISFLSAFFLIFLCFSCGGVSNLEIGKDGSASLELSVSVPEVLETKISQYASGEGPLLNADVISESIKSRGITVKSSVSDRSNTYKGVFFTKNLNSLFNTDKDLSSVLEYKNGKNWASIRLFLTRENAKSIIKLFSGIDENIIEALQPPAIYDNPVSGSEYRMMLSSLLGKKVLTAIDNLPFEIKINTPGTIIESRGVSLDIARRSATLKIPGIDVFILENPIELFIKWQE